MLSKLIPLAVVGVCVAVTQVVAYFTSDRNNFNMNYVAIYTIGLQWLVYIHAGGFFGNERTEKYYDLTGCLTYLTTLGLNYFLNASNFGVRQIYLSTLIGIWTVRLGSFLFMRIHNNNGVDSRFTEIKACLCRFFMTWTLQGVWVFLTILPLLVISQQKIDQPALNYIDYIGIGLWSFGFIFEVVADQQKSNFRKNPENKDKFISTGLWSISRHPNYFGEIVVWIGVSVSAFSGVQTWSVFVSPVFIALLLIFVSGIPMLERKADTVYGNDEKYQQYKKGTPTLVPFIGRRGDAMF
jgi:steroid 5-alpha reductase family enzyme